ncbi:MAG: hypothetical protein ACF8QF_07870 [Phycisphaerales bacterium]
MGLIRNLKSRILGGKAPTLSLFAFGKHPAWSDHIEPGIGELTDPILAFKKRLYNGGIKKLIDTGAWVGKADGELVDRFGHEFVALGERSVLVGRMWASSDARGRGEFPMVALVQAEGVPIRWLQDVAMGAVRTFEEHARASRNEAGVLAAHQAAQQDLRRRLTEFTDPGGVPDRDDPDLPQILDRFFTSGAFGPSSVGLLRILRVVEQAAPASKGAPASSLQIRAPRSIRDDSEELVDWALLVDAALGGPSAVIALRPDEGQWLDLLAGPPRADEFYCLRATPAELPLDSDTPYDLDPGLESRWRARAASKPTTRF